MNLNIEYDEVRAKIINEVNADTTLKVLVNPKELTNLNPQSRFMRIVNAVSKTLVYFIGTILQNIFDSIFPSTSDRYALARHLREEGLEFKPATKSEGIVRIGSTTLPDRKIDIPQGSLPKTAGNDSLVYETIEAAYVDPSTPVDANGYYTAAVTVRAMQTGEEYNILTPGVICELENSIEGIDIIYNPGDVAGGADEESNYSAYARLKDKKNISSRGTKNWFKSEAEKIAGVSQAVIVARYGGRGTVGILVVGEGGEAPQSVLDAVAARFNTDDEDPAGAFHVIAARPESFVQNYSITVWYDPDKGVPGNAELDTVVSDYLASLNPGEDQVLEVIKARIIAFGMKDVRINSPLANVIVPENKVSVAGVNTWEKLEWMDA